MRLNLVLLKLKEIKITTVIQPLMSGITGKYTINNIGSNISIQKLAKLKTKFREFTEKWRKFNPKVSNGILDRMSKRFLDVFS